MTLRPSVLSGVLAAALLLTACREEQLPVASTAARQEITENAWDFCATSLDRHPPPSLQGDFRDPPDVLAGFVAYWYPGAAPFPCNRYKRANVQGLFSFDVRSRRNPAMPERFRSAILELISFEPVQDSVRVNHDVDLGGTRWVCTFKVERVQDSWGGLGFMSQRFVGTVPLSARARRITVSTAGASRWTADVSAEAGAWYEGRDAETGFAIVQDSSAFTANRNNNCAGRFRFRLRLFVGE